MAYWRDDKANKPPEHRKGPDLLVKWVRFSSFLSWLLFFGTVLMWDSAKPEIHTILDMQYGKRSRGSWDGDLLNIAFAFSIVTFVFVLISLLFNSQRLRRKLDGISVSLVIVLILSGITMVGFFVNYIANL